MKKQMILIAFFLLLLLPKNVNAASITVRPSTSSAVVGGTVTVRVTLQENKGLGSWEYSLNYDSSILQLTSGNTHVVDYVQGQGEKSRTYTYTFKVKKAGTAKVSVVNTNIVAWDETSTYPTDSTTFKCVSQEEITASYSKNNNLKSLGVEGYELAFDKNTQEYSLEVEADVTKVNLQAEVEDSKASLTGTGEKEVHEGSNAFQIVVTAQNGATKTYTITINVKSLNPINVKIAKEDYTIVRKIDEIKDKVPTSFTEITTKIQDEDVLAFENKTLKLIIVALKDAKGEISFYTYQNNKYEAYQELKGGALTIRILDDKTKLPKDYIATTVTIDGVKLPLYHLKGNHDFYLVYGQNVETGKKALYQYDKQEKTLQRYQDEEIKNLTKANNNKTYLLLGSLGIIIVLLISLLFLLQTKQPKKKLNKK